MKGLARAAGRNNATFQPTPEGTSPIMSMFLWDGIGCWGEDVDGDGSLDIDADYDADVVLHEYHHGVSHRLNTSFTGAEANAMGEGGSDFFAYTVNGDTILADFARPGGIRNINAKTYDDWTCLLIVFCEEHDNGEIWANVLWDVRERFRTDLVRGSEAAAINEASQLYVDALKLSPPSPTMLDMRDAMLLADSIRNPGVPRSQNFCALWESFAVRGMGVNATDTARQRLQSGRGQLRGAVGLQRAARADDRQRVRLSVHRERGRTGRRRIHRPAQRGYGQRTRRERRDRGHRDRGLRLSAHPDRRHDPAGRAVRGGPRYADRRPHDRGQRVGRPHSRGRHRLPGGNAVDGHGVDRERRRAAGSRRQHADRAGTRRARADDGRR